MTEREHADLRAYHAMQHANDAQNQLRPIVEGGRQPREAVADIAFHQFVQDHYGALANYESEPHFTQVAVRAAFDAGVKEGQRHG